MKDFAKAKLLGNADLDQVAAMVSNLLEEVVTLSERIAQLEGDKTPDAAQERVNAVVERVLAPLSKS